MSIQPVTMDYSDTLVAPGREPGTTGASGGVGQSRGQSRVLTQGGEAGNSSRGERRGANDAADAVRSDFAGLARDALEGDDGVLDGFAVALTGKTFSELEDSGEDAAFIEFLLDVSEGGIRPDIRVAGDGIEARTQGDWLPSNVAGAFVPGAGEPGTILIKRGLEPEHRDAVMVEEFGEAVAVRAREMGVEVRAGDAGARLAYVGSGETPPRDGALYTRQTSDTADVVLDGQAREALANTGAVPVNTIGLDGLLYDLTKVSSYQAWAQPFDTDGSGRLSTPELSRAFSLSENHASRVIKLYGTTDEAGADMGLEIVQATNSSGNGRGIDAMIADGALVNPVGAAILSVDLARASANVLANAVVRSVARMSKGAGDARPISEITQEIKGRGVTGQELDWATDDLFGDTEAISSKNSHAATLERNFGVHQGGNSYKISFNGLAQVFETGAITLKSDERGWVPVAVDPGQSWAGRHNEYDTVESDGAILPEKRDGTGDKVQSLTIHFNPGAEDVVNVQVNQGTAASPDWITVVTNTNPEATKDGGMTLDAKGKYTPEDVRIHNTTTGETFYAATNAQVTPGADDGMAMRWEDRKVNTAPGTTDYGDVTVIFSTVDVLTTTPETRRSYISSLPTAQAAAELVKLSPKDAAAVLSMISPSKALDILAIIRDAQAAEPSGSGRSLEQFAGLEAVVESFLASTVGELLKYEANQINAYAIAGGALLGGVVAPSDLTSYATGMQIEEAVASVDTRSEMQNSFGVADDWTSMSEPEVVLRLAAAPSNQAAVDLLAVIPPDMKAEAVASLATSAIPGETGPGSLHRTARAARVGDLIAALTGGDKGATLAEIAEKDIDAATRIIGTMSPEAAAQAMKSLDPAQIAAILNRLAETGNAALAGGILASLSTLNPAIMAGVEALLMPIVPRQTAPAAPEPDPPNPPTTSTTPTDPEPSLPPVNTLAAQGTGAGDPSKGHIPTDANKAKKAVEEQYEANGVDDFELLNTPRLGGQPAPRGPAGISDEAKEIAELYQTEDGAPTQALKSLRKTTKDLNSRKSATHSATILKNEEKDYKSAASQIQDLYSDLERLRGRPLLSWETSNLIRETISDFNVVQDRQTSLNPDLYKSAVIPSGDALVTLTTVRYSGSDFSQRTLSNWRNGTSTLAQPGEARLTRYMNDFFTRNGSGTEGQGGASITKNYPADVTSQEAKLFLEAEAKKMEQAFGLPDYRKNLIENGIEQEFIDYLNNAIDYNTDFTIGESLPGMGRMRGQASARVILNQRAFNPRSAAEMAISPPTRGKYVVRVNLSNASSTAGALGTLWHELTHVSQSQTADIYKAAISYAAKTVPPAQAQAKIEEIMTAFGVSIDYANLMLFQQRPRERSALTSAFYKDSVVEGEAWEATWNFLDSLEHGARSSSAPEPDAAEDVSAPPRLIVDRPRH